MNFQRSHRVAVLAILAGLTPACGGKPKSDIPQTGPAYILTTEGADDDVHDVFLEILQERMKPVRVVGKGEQPISLGTIHAVMRVHEIRYETSDRKEQVGVPTDLSAEVSIVTLGGSSNWDGDHSIGFETDPPGTFRDATKTRRRWARKLLEVAVKQLPEWGTFKYMPAQAPR